MHPPRFRTLLNELHLPLHLLTLLSQWNKHFGKDLNHFENQPILIIPGFGASDHSTILLRKFLSAAGLTVYGWGLGKNNGNVRYFLPLLEKRTIDISTEHGEPPILIGWSLGGLLAREIARNCREHVRAVCCLGSPIVGGPAYTIYAPLLKYLKRDLTAVKRAVQARESVPIQVPSHVIYSKKDGIVHWEACVDCFNTHTTHTELNTPHFSMGTSVEVYRELLRWLDSILKKDATPQCQE